jgi:hypothetical protein
MNNQLILDTQAQIALTMDEANTITAARAIEDQMNTALASGQPLDLSAPVNVAMQTAQGETSGPMVMQDLLLTSPEIVAELDPFTVQALQTQVTQQLEEAVASGNSTELAMNITLAANLGLDPGAIITQLKADTELALTEAYAAGDATAVEALMPAVILLGIDAEAVRTDAIQQVEMAVDGGTATALVNMTADVDVQMGEIDGATGTVTVQVIGGDVQGGGQVTGGESIPEHHSGGIFEAPHGQDEGIALLEDGEVIRTSGQESALASRQGRGGGNSIQIVLYGSSPYAVLEMTERAARERGYE